MDKRADLSSFDLDTVLRDALRRAGSLLPCDSGGVLVYTPARERLVMRVYRGRQQPPRREFAVGDSIVGVAASTLQPVVVPDMRADARCTFFDPDSRSELAVPIVFQGELVGVVNVESSLPDAYTSHHVAVLGALAADLGPLIQLAGRYAALAGSHSDLAERVHLHRRESDALQRLVSITASALDLDSMLARAVAEAVALLDCEGAQLLLPNHSTYRLEVHLPSLVGTARELPPAAWALDGPGTVVDVYHTGRPFVSFDPPTSAGLPCHSTLICPLNTHNRTLGVLHLINRCTGAFTEGDVQIAQAIANQIAISMSSVQMLAAERYRLDLLKQVNRVSQELSATLEPQGLVRLAAQRIRTVFEPESVHIFVVDPQTQVVRLGASASVAPQPGAVLDPVFLLDAGVIDRALTTGQTQVVGDLRDTPGYVPPEGYHRLQSCLVVPLRRGDETFGALSLLSTALDAFGEMERDALETLATQMSTSLHNAQLYNQAQRRLLEQGIVYQIGQELTAILHYRELSQVMVQHMNRALNTSGCLVALYEPAAGSVRVEADYRAPHHHRPDGPLITGQLLPLDDHEAIARALRTQEPVTVYRDDLTLSPGERALIDQLGDHGQLILPLIAGERVLGVVDWTDNQPGRRFTSDDIRLARTLVAQATIAVENALLFRQLEEHAHELSEANRLRSQFLATISHELRTPMNSIIGFSETLIDGLYGELNEKQSSRMDRIRRNGYALLALIDDLLDLSRIDAGRMKLNLETLHVGHAIVTAAQNFEIEAQNHGLSLTLNLPDTLPHVSADPERLHQVLINLLSNAVKFTHEGGITISAALIQQENRPYIAVTVADTGIGISEPDQAIIFDEFRQVDGSSTRAYGGTGLGLAITKKLVEMMGGTVGVESTLGEGSAFTFTLPVMRLEQRESGNVPAR